MNKNRNIEYDVFETGFYGESRGPGCRDDEVILTLEKWRLAKRGFDVCGEAGTGAAALECAAKMQPDIVLMDISLSGEMVSGRPCR